MNAGHAGQFIVCSFVQIVYCAKISLVSPFYTCVNKSGSVFFQETVNSLTSKPEHSPCAI